MFTPITRVLLVIFSLLTATYFYSKEDFINMSMMLIAGGLFTYGYFKYGTVYIALKQIQKNNIPKAEQLISKIKHPEKLTKGHKSYYYFATGFIALEKEEFEKSYSDLAKALEIGLRTENDKSIAFLNLAKIDFWRKDYNKATEHIKKARQLSSKPLVTSEINQLEEEINTAQQDV